MNVNIYLGYHVQWNTNEGAYGYAISGLYGPRKVRYFDPVKLDDPTPVILALNALRAALSDVQIHRGSDITLTIYSGVKDVAVIGAIRTILKNVPISIQSGKQIGAYNSIHEDLYRSVESAAMIAFGRTNSFKFKVHKVRENDKVTKKLYSRARVLAAGNQPVESSLTDVIDLSARRA